jgi:hypothetical protein
VKKTKLSSFHMPEAAILTEIIRSELFKQGIDPVGLFYYSIEVEYEEYEDQTNIEQLGE